MIAPRTGSRSFRISTFAVILCALALGGAHESSAQDDVGLSSVGAQRLGREELPNANVDGNDRFGFAFAVGDFNGDGADDLATGAPLSDGPAANPVDQCGEVVVRYGLPGAGLDALGVPVVLGQFAGGTPEPGDLFGRALAACDLDQDGFDDLAVGVPLEDLVVGGFTDIVDSGVVEVYYGGNGGLSVSAGAVLSSNGIEAAGQKLGWALACGDFNGDGFDDLAAGLPGRVVNGDGGAGRIRVYPGSAAGVGAGAYSLDQDSPEMLGAADAGDSFGTQLAAGNFNGDTRADLAIAVPMEVFAGADPVGAVQIVYGATSGLTGINSEVVPNPDPEGDPDEGSFGLALAAGEFDGLVGDELLIGSPGDDGDVAGGGAVYLLRGSGGGLGSIVARISPDLYFPDGESEALDSFGHALAVGDFDGDGVDDIAVGTPGEEVSGNLDGEVMIFTGSDETRARRIRHGLEGFPGASDEHGLELGAALAAGDFDGDGHADLAIGAPIESEADLAGVGTATILYGALFADGFEGTGFLYWSTFFPQQ